METFLYIDSIAEGAYGCTFRIRDSNTNIEYALKVEKYDSEVHGSLLRFKQEGVYLYLVSSNVDNPFQLRLKDGYLIKNEILPTATQAVMQRHCPEKYAEWRESNFKGTFMFLQMELGIGNATDTQWIVRTHTRQFALGMCYALYSIRKVGIIHGDVRVPNIILKSVARLPEIRLLVPEREDVEFAYPPAEDVIPCLIDYGLSIINYKQQPSEYELRRRLEDSERLYGPQMVLQYNVHPLNGLYVYTNRIDYWMLALVIAETYADSREQFYSMYTEDASRVPMSVYTTYMERGYSTTDIGVLWSMALLSDAFDSLDHVPLAFLGEMQGINPFAYIAQRMEPDLRLFMGKLLSWETGSVDTVEMLDHAYFEELSLFYD